MEQIKKPEKSLQPVIANPRSIKSHSAQAPFYKFRVPYSTKMFADLSDFLPMDPNSIVMDAGCGTGHVTEKLIHHAQHVHAVDGSAEMIEYAKKFGNATFYTADLNNQKFIVPNGVDHIFFGRSIHHFPTESIQSLVNNNLREKGALITCSSEWFADGDWGDTYSRIKKKYEEDANPTSPNNSKSSNVTGHSNLPPLGFVPQKKFVDAFRVLVDARYLSRLTLARAYGTALDNLLNRFDDFEAEMQRALLPHLINGKLKMIIRSWAFVWRRNESDGK